MLPIRRGLTAAAALTGLAGAALSAACSDTPTGNKPTNTSRVVSVQNPSGAAVQAALVVINTNTGDKAATAAQQVTVTAAGVAAPAALADRGLADAGVTGGAAGVSLGAGLGAPVGAQAPVMSDAGVMRRIRDEARRRGGLDVGGLKALYDRARASGDFGAWRRPAAVARAGGVARSVGSAGANAVSADVAPGDVVQLNVRVPGGAASDNTGSGDADCGTPNRVNARIAAVSSRAVVAVDARNPAGGLSDAFYQSVAQAFDTLVYPTDVRTFGAPVDIDQNGRVILFYTRAVNGLTAAGSQTYVGGFFYSRDLRPTAGGSSLTPACAGSNAGEIFYLLAPDPGGQINGNVRDTSFIRLVTLGTVAHEFQHLINAERRLFVLGTGNFDEDVWLNEGLSHVAEEITFYRSGGLSPAGQAGQSPRARLTRLAIQRGGAIPALNNFGFQNLTRFSLYLQRPDTASPYADNDELSTRGATWSFLRYAADRSGATDSAFFGALVNSNRLGLDNVGAVLAARGGASAGVPIGDWLRDWAVANYADGLAANVAPQYTQPSWVFRDVLTQFTRGDGSRFNNGIYPLTGALRALGAGAPQTLSLAGGEASYFLFTIPAGGTASVTVAADGTAAGSVQTALVQATGAGAGAVSLAQ